MSDHKSEISEGLEEESRMTGHRITSGVKGLLGRGWGVTFGENPRELKDWMASIGKGQLIYELSERETLYLAYNATERKVSEFIWSPDGGPSIDMDRPGEYVDPRICR